MKYKILDNFLSKEDFEHLVQYKNYHLKKNEIKIFNNKVFLNKQVETSNLNKNYVLKLHRNYHSIALEILKDLNPVKISLYEYSEFHLIYTGADYKYPIHRDSPYKLLSGVIYLYPEKNTGTILYNNKYGDDPHEIKWKQNRGFFFSRNENNSFHSYEGDGLSNRLALVYNLMTTKLKEVCNLENINYKKVKLREMINPYLYRFLRKII